VPHHLEHDFPDPYEERVPCAVAQRSNELIRLDRQHVRPRFPFMGKKINTHAAERNHLPGNARGFVELARKFCLGASIVVMAVFRISVLFSLTPSLAAL
jgi:hypothetical protein